MWRDGGFPDRALADAHRALYYAPSSASAHNTLGTVFQALGPAQRGTISVRACGVARSDCRVRAEQPLLRVDSGASAEQGGECLPRGARMDPTFRAARNNLGLAYAASGDIDAARRAFNAGGDPAAAEYNLGIVQLARHRYADAVTRVHRGAADATQLANRGDACQAGGKAGQGRSCRMTTTATTEKELRPATAVANLHPSSPRTLEDAGLSHDFITQLLLKVMHFSSDITGLDLARRIGLEFAAIEPVLEFLKRSHQCEVYGGTMLGGPSYKYRITDEGRRRALLFLEQNHYVGVAPVPLRQYRAYLEAYRAAVPKTISRPRVRDAFSHLVISQRVLDQVGPAIAAGHSMFVYGPPGNGKTVIAQAIRNLLDGEISIPHAIEVEGQIIKVFDPVNHERLEENTDSGLMVDSRLDARWVRCRRPMVMVGGELTLEALGPLVLADHGFLHGPGADNGDRGSAGHRRLRAAALFSARAAEPLDRAAGKPRRLSHAANRPEVRSAVHDARRLCDQHQAG
jgi:tetratricopeptide (TPR) repeat protein